LIASSAPQPFQVARIGVDPGTFGVFYEEHFDRVLGFVTRRVSDPYLAADLTADVFVAAIESASSYRPDRAVPVAWLYGIARHVVARHASRARREFDAMARFAGQQMVDADDIAVIEDRIDAARSARALADACAALPPSLQAVVELVGVDGLTVAAAAQVLGIRPSSVRVRLFRARRLLNQSSRLVDQSVLEVTS